MKKILLLDFNEAVASYFAASGEYELVAIAYEERTYNAYKKILPKSASLYLVDEIQKNADLSFFTYDLAEKYRYAQRKAEYGFIRGQVPVWKRDSIYYSALAFWEKLFNEKSFDLVFCLRTEHGSPIESIALVMARYRGIRSLVLQEQQYSFYSLVDFNKNKLVPLGDFAATSDDFKKLTSAIPQAPAVNEHKVKAKLRKLLGQLVCETLSLLFIKKTCYRRVHCFDYPIFKGYGKLMRMWLRRFGYKYVSTKHNCSKKYIYFSLHLEPEAATGPRVTLSNQLFLIRMLANALPHGWEILVKEHPVQFNLNKKGKLLFLPCAHEYKTYSFYKEITSIKNVELVSLDVPSSKLIDGAIAVASIAGTCALEALQANKPNILFEKDLSIYRDAESCLHVTSQKECCEAIKTLQERQFDDADFERDLNSICTYCMPRAMFSAEKIFSMLKLSA